MKTFPIKKHWITEKATLLNEQGKYVFMVAPEATKPEIRKAIRELYKVDAVSVRIVNRPPKPKRFGTRVVKKDPHKKAIVTLQDGQKIDVT